MENHKPFQSSRPVGHIITLLIIITGLGLLLLGNSNWFDNRTVLTGDVAGLLSNTGFAVLIAAFFNWMLDHKFKEQFYKDIHHEIVASHSIRDSRIIRVWEDSKDVNYRDLIKSAKIMRIGVTYSDRFLKDYLGCFEQARPDLKVIIYLSDTDNKDCAALIASNTNQKPEDIARFGKSTQSYIAALINKDIDIEVFTQRTLPHYAFISFNDDHHFIIMSTFASRRAEVPVLECGEGGVFDSLIKNDLKEIESWNTSIKKPSVSLMESLKSMALKLLNHI
ncbi:hypothetical protein [Sphingomonas sp. AX6]|uniref:hypothetical protein n=1 Tax=Sphingomonas sp. AX6 TaxID=2653171 RepID=UPI0012EF77F8|nr:hypothetical protein [Sphingomonas sp. AX6]VXC81669.1 conserved hypothetical protein [Sphingomonas sp. AX6]